MHPFTVLSRLLMFALTAGACLWLTTTLGPALAIPVWAAAITALCAAAAFLLYRQAAGKITFINRIAGFLLPWGYKFGRGRLPAIVATSAICWTLLGAAVIVLAPQGLAILSAAPTPSAPAAPTAAGTYQRSPILLGLLFLSWLIVGIVLLRLLNTVFARISRVPPGVIAPTLGLMVLLIASVLLTIFGGSAATTWLALALTGGPIVVVGGGYGLFLLVVLTVGRNTRWN